MAIEAAPGSDQLVKIGRYGEPVAWYNKRYISLFKQNYTL